MFYYFGENMDLKSSKRELIRLIHLGKPRSDLPILWNLAAEVNKAVDVVIVAGRETDGPEAEFDLVRVGLSLPASCDDQKKKKYD